MKKKIALIIILIVGIFIVIDIVTFQVPKSHPSYFVWADKAINVYDRKNDTKKTYEFAGYNCRDIGKYYGGDFCCIGDKDGTPYALLFKDGIIEYYISLPYEAEQIAVWQNDIIFRSDEKIYSIDKQSQECKLLVDNVANRLFYINENGDIAFLKNTDDKNSSDYKDSSYNIFHLYIYLNNHEEYIGDVGYILYWQSNEELITQTFYENGDKIKAEYIINIKTNVWKKVKLFKNVVSIASWKQGSTAICWFTAIGETEYQPLGIVNVDKKAWSSSCYDNKNLNSLTGPHSFEWYEENPMEKQN